ncbi:hypothetical protein C3B51_12500 [Pseudoalteromonas rubra]|uniref:Uncharacterized protein n=1 Tax=Pseudoalteromonas rubra TaxID=43658 RepID=A0A4Q7ECA0_9GAMM|nr:hypothetical protein [Pseudoalteromonas rubra]RZM80372.1 hypothetical protein C3B51_12500 [Pseudoalteromonas rubra]
MQYELKYLSEIKFGPAYYLLTVADKKVPNFVYGFTRSELQDGRYLAIEEWLTTDYQKGPITRVAIFDLENKLVTRLATVKKGFVDSFKLKNNIFTYNKTYHGNGKVVESEIDWNLITQWSDAYL